MKNRPIPKPKLENELDAFINKSNSDQKSNTQQKDIHQTENLTQSESSKIKVPKSVIKRSLTLSKETDDKLRLFVAKKRITPSKCIEEAIIEYIKNFI
jgi:hypothetical protein